MKKFLVWVLILAAGVGAGWFIWGKKNSPVVSQVVKNFAQTQAQPSKVASLNGELVDSAAAQKRPIAVMVENHPDSRPQSGLADADMVYEALAEGGITRFMAVYQVHSSSNIGPVRSARTYFAELADELGAVYAHVGGNSDVLANIRAGDYKNISNADQFFLDPYFHRIKARLMPHNVYTTTATLNKLFAAERFGTQATYQSWQYKDDSPTSSQASIKKISIDFSEPLFAVTWKYDSSSNLYYRYLAGLPHKDADTGKQITAKNIIVQSVAIHPVVSDTPLSIGMDLDQGGKAAVFLDGKVITGTWAKENGRTRYYDQTGKEILFNRGQTWVEIVPIEKFANLSWKP